jgi:hypothetical protein
LNVEERTGFSKSLNYLLAQALVVQLPSTIMSEGISGLRVVEELPLAKVKAREDEDG